MNEMMILLAAAGGTGQNGGQGSPIGVLLPFILIFAIMYFLIFRPQAKKQKEHRQMLEKLEKGDQIVTAGGIYGTIVSIKDKEGTIVVKVADNVKIEFSKSAVAKKANAGS